MDQFAVHLMPHLLTLANDRVPNVRVLLAKTLRQTLLEKGGQCGAGEPLAAAGLGRSRAGPAPTASSKDRAACHHVGTR